MGLDTQQQILVEQRLANEKKNMVVAYLLWFFIGWAGAHRFYLQQTGTAVAILLLSIFGVILSFVGVGIFILIGVGIWLFVDLFLIPGYVDADASEKRTRITQELSYASTPNIPAVSDTPTAS